MTGFWALLLILLLNAFIPAGVTSSVCFLLIFLVLLRGRYSFRIPTDLLKWSAVPCAILFVAALNAPGHDLFDIFKDAWYMLYPILSLAAGYVLCREDSDLDSLMGSFVLGGLIVSLAYLAVFLIHINLVSKSVEEIRRANGPGFFLSILAPMIVVLGWLLGVRNTWIEKHQTLTMVSVFTCLAATFLSFSRSLWISILLAIVANLGVFRKKLIVAVAGCLLLVLLVAVVVALPDSTASEDSGGIQQKFLKSATEVMVQNQTDYTDINANWRGFEAFMALRTYLEGTPSNYLLGRGLGQLVDIGFYMQLGDVELRYLPILHNGYMYILVKSGAIGVVLYLVYLLTIFRHGRRQGNSTDKRDLLCGRLEIVISLIFLTTTLVITGIYNRNELHPLMILLGVCLAATNGQKDSWMHRLPSEHTNQS
jgi:O-Antigen ligase